jgi:hypothetical protein
LANNNFSALAVDMEVASRVTQSTLCGKRNDLIDRTRHSNFFQTNTRGPTLASGPIDVHWTGFPAGREVRTTWRSGGESIEAIC